MYILPSCRILTKKANLHLHVTDDKYKRLNLENVGMTEWKYWLTKYTNKLGEHNPQPSLHK